MTSSTPIHIVTHAECLDGIAAAWAVQTHYEQSSERGIYIEYQSYNRPLPEFPEGAHVVMVDFCPNDVNELKTLMRRAASLVVLDHHPKSEAVFQEMKAWVIAEKLQANFDCMFSQYKSGALLAWEYFHEGEAPELLQLVSDNDLWQFKLPLSKDVCAALDVLGMSIPAFDDCLKKNILELAAAGPVLREAQRQHIDWTIQHTRCVFNAHQWVGRDIEEVYLLAVNGNNFIKNEVCARLEQMYPGFAGYVCYWDLTDGQNRRYCVRSKQGNARAIARCYGGEGHDGAAGFVLPRDSGLEIVMKADDDRPCPAC